MGCLTTGAATAAIGQQQGAQQGRQQNSSRLSSNKPSVPKTAARIAPMFPLPFPPVPPVELPPVPDGVVTAPLPPGVAGVLPDPEGVLLLPPVPAVVGPPGPVGPVGPVFEFPVVAFPPVPGAVVAFPPVPGAVVMLPEELGVVVPLPPEFGGVVPFGGLVLPVVGIVQLPLTNMKPAGQEEQPPPFSEQFAQLGPQGAQLLVGVEPKPGLQEP